MAVGQKPVGSKTDACDGREDRRQSPDGPFPGKKQRQQESGDEDEEDLETPRPSWHGDRVSRQKVVDDRGMDLDPRLGGFQRCGAYLLEPGCGGSEHDHLPLQQGRICRPLQDSRGGDVGDDLSAAAVVHQEIAAAVEGDSPSPQTQRFDPFRPCLQDGIAAACVQSDGEGETGIEETPVADHEGNATQHPVRVGGDVEKTGGACRPGKSRHVAHDAGGVEQIRGDSCSASRVDCRTQRVQDARLSAHRVEVELVAEDEWAGGEGLRQCAIGVQCFGGDLPQVDPHPEVAADLPGEHSQRRPVGFGKDHVETDRRGTTLQDLLQKAGNPVARPRPLSQALEARLVDVHHRHGAGYRVVGSGTQEGIVHLPVQEDGKGRGPYAHRPHEQSEDDAGQESGENRRPGRDSHLIAPSPPRGGSAAREPGRRWEREGCPPRGM